ncbi:MULTISPECIES: MerR family transcriptional regulator [Geobacillus]|uniref:MerR family transcriptional regulator n=1 Tax=Geobacillus TaxID=129337 RepID=UPI0005A81ECE|nr:MULTISPECIES: MerR family transcriptional regulator [Geobacillus]AOL33348.1 MerR family transcriptional regulator [Geobacillus thermoleovorans]MED4971728.1 MerR family transcriptional regulator [Geobacillus thermoleovorans]QCK81761.1 MerR family transcriptional regulator [Geobacillus kaustophilus NBRC 102445]TRY35924.1 MerR family transcriptional regulator [Geobacillus sp. LEMMJ02]WMJ20401.1 MerR family transcriptional regulator [Geobacillus kaustophilus]
MERFKIDDVAKATGLTKRTIRYYEEIGLIKPPARSEKGTRLYTADDIEQLKNIIAAREVLGFSLQELHHFLTLKEKIETHRAEYRQAAASSEQRRELEQMAAGLHQQIAMLDDKMKKMTALKQELNQMAERIDAILKERREE